MLQRIQSLFLAIIGISMGAFTALPLWDKTAADQLQTAHLTALRLVHKQGITEFVTPTWYMAVLAAVVGLVAVFTIFQYKNRLLQSGLCAVNSILMTVLMGLTMYFIFGKGQKFFEPEVQGHFDFGFYALITALLANVLANRFIRRDEKFVRSQDRMR
jgi:glucan phosphoethanolaminetransferase (alkaline phosphatase superfamily)